MARYGRNFSGFDPSSAGGYSGFGANEGKRTSAQFRSAAQNTSSNSGVTQSRNLANRAKEVDKGASRMEILANELKLQLDSSMEANVF